MSRVDSEFVNRVYGFVANIPRGRIVTYGQVAAACGASWAAWEVGQIAHSGPKDLPWHRVVNKQGRLATGYPGGMTAHRQALESEGIKISDDFRLDVGMYLWLIA
ncbi:MGMT family protein [Candidatus Saccharibacteria bacterium]|nr:MGMT family protein [Candidatus Saccharibacteria bacterium]